MVGLLGRAEIRSGSVGRSGPSHTPGQDRVAVELSLGIHVTGEELADIHGRLASADGCSGGPALHAVDQVTDQGDACERTGGGLGAL